MEQAPFVSKTCANPFKELYKNSSQFNQIAPAILSDYENLIQVSINLTQEAEKFRKEALKYKTLNTHLVEQCDKLQHEYEYIDARYAMAKKWLKNEFELRESAEKERDVLAQIVQLCKELIEEDPKFFDQLGFLNGIPEVNDDVRSVNSERSEKVDELLKKIKRVDRSKNNFDMNDLRAEIEEMEPQNMESTFDETADILNDILSPEKVSRKRRSSNFRRRSAGRRQISAPQPSGYTSFIDDIKEKIPEEPEEIENQQENMSILGENCHQKDPITDKYLYAKKSRRDSGHGGRRRMSREFRIQQSGELSDKQFDEFTGIVEDKNYSESAKESEVDMEDNLKLGRKSKFQELAKKHENRINEESDTVGSMLPIKGDPKPFKKRGARRSIFNPSIIGTPGKTKIKKVLGQPFRSEKMNLIDYCVEDNNANRPIIPIVLQAAIFELKRRNAIEFSQVYRQVGNKLKVNDLSQSLLVKNLSLQAAKKELSKVRDTATITSFIKNFFSSRILEPVLTYDGLTFIVDLVNKDKASRDAEINKKYSPETINKISLVLKQLKPVNLDTLSMMMLHFQAVVSSSHKNKINVNTLAKNLASSLIGHRVSKPSYKDLKMADGYQVKVFKALMQIDGGFYRGYYKEIADGAGVVESKSSIINKAKKLIFE